MINKKNKLNTVIPRLPMEAVEILRRASSVPSKNRYDRNRMKRRVRRQLETAHLADVF
jgi:hypothetical protein